MWCRQLYLLLLVAPARVYFTAHPRAALLRQPRLARVPPVFAAEEEDLAAAYRELGLSEDATYDEITDTCLELSERYAADVGRVASLEKSKQIILDDRLSQRMRGTLQAQYEGQVAREDRPPPRRTPILEILNGARKKLILVPSPKYAFNVIGLLGGLTLATWVAPNTAGTIMLINVVSGMGFIYNRGEADVVRDDFGQVGEIRPMKPKPFMLTAAITTFFWIFGYIKAKQAVAAVVNPPRTLELVLRTTYISLGLIIPALFVKVHSIFD